jgi:hypothetical protein
VAARNHDIATSEHPRDPLEVGRPEDTYLVVLADDVCDLDADRGRSSAVVESFAAVGGARADACRDDANLVSKLEPRGCNFVPVVRELAAVVGFDADDVRELPPDVKLLANDRREHGHRLWEHAADGWELPYSSCELPPCV